MDLTQKVFSDVLEVLRVRPHSESKNRADDASSYSDLRQWKINPECLKSARNTRIVLIAIAFLGLNPDQEVNLRKQILKVGLKWSFQGEWETVKLMALQKPFTPARVLQAHLKDRSPQDFYGNDLSAIKRAWFFGLKSYDPYANPSSRVRQPKRKRGYDDKGQLPVSSYGAGNTTKLTPRPPAEEPPEVEPTNTLWHTTLDREKSLGRDPGGKPHIPNTESNAFG